MPVYSMIGTPVIVGGILYRPYSLYCIDKLQIGVFLARNRGVFGEKSGCFWREIRHNVLNINILQSLYTLYTL